MTETEFDIKIADITRNTTLSAEERARQIDVLKAERDSVKTVAENHMQRRYKGPAANKETR